MSTPRRVSLGFEGGQTLALRASDKAIAQLEKALSNGGWHDLESDDGTVRLWDVADPADPRSLGQPLTGSGAAVDSVAISADGRTLASAAAQAPKAPTPGSTTPSLPATTRGSGVITASAPARASARSTLRRLPTP